MFAPKTVSADGIIEFTWEATDDGQHAIVEFVARDRAALQPILNDSRLAGRRFEKGRSTKEEIERELKKHKRDFDAVTFVGGRK